jgi:hypothetical protein
MVLSRQCALAFIRRKEGNEQHNVRLDEVDGRVVVVAAREIKRGDELVVKYDPPRPYNQFALDEARVRLQKQRGALQMLLACIGMKDLGTITTWVKDGSCRISSSNKAGRVLWLAERDGAYLRSCQFLAEARATMKAKGQSDKYKVHQVKRLAVSKKKHNIHSETKQRADEADSAANSQSTRAFLSTPYSSSSSSSNSISLRLRLRRLRFRLRFLLPLPSIFRFLPCRFLHRPPLAHPHSRMRSRIESESETAGAMQQAP